MSMAYSPSKLSNYTPDSFSTSQTQRTPKKTLAQGNLVLCSNSQSAVFNPQTKSDVFPSNCEEDDEVSTPRKVQQSIYGFSPSKQKPTSELDLSDDAQPDITEKAEAQLTNQHNTSVVVVDALSQRIADGVAEVPVTEKLEVSPHKVICHSPRAAQLSLRNTGDTHQAANVHVDLLHSVSVGSLAKPEDARPMTEPQAADANEDNATANSSNASTGVELGNDEPASIQDISLELDRMKLQKTEKVLPKNKKKVGREVASRLMNTTCAHRAKSVGQSQQSAYQSMLQKGSSSRKPKYINEIPPGSKPPRVQRVRSQRQASTPEREKVAPDESFDVSVLHGNRTMINRNLNETVSFLAPPPTEPVAAEKKSSAAAKRVNSSEKPVVPEDITQGSMDVHHARSLQWVHLASKARRSIETEEKDVMGQLQRLWVESHNLRQRLSALEQEYDRLQHTADLEEMLDLQKSALGPVVHELPQLTQYYQSMAVALDTTRHELQTQGIHIPDSKPEQEEFEETLLSALDESEQLVASVASHTRRNVSTMSQYAQAIDALTKSAHDEQKELQRCKTLVRAAQTLSNQDNSMRIQQIEISRTQV